VVGDVVSEHIEAWLVDTEGSHPDLLVITPDTYNALRHHRDLADAIMTTLGYSADDVVEMRVSEGHTEVDWLWRDADGRIVFVDDHLDTRTTIIEATRFFEGPQPESALPESLSLDRSGSATIGLDGAVTSRIGRDRAAPG
jgi:phosphoribosylpyrophosphate synthetase